MKKVVKSIRKFETWTIGGYGLLRELIQTWEIQAWEDREGDFLNLEWKTVRQTKVAVQGYLELRDC